MGCYWQFGITINYNNGYSFVSGHQSIIAWYRRVRWYRMTERLWTTTPTTLTPLTPHNHHHPASTILMTPSHPPPPGLTRYSNWEPIINRGTERDRDSTPWTARRRCTRNNSNNTRTLRRYSTLSSSLGRIQMVFHGMLEGSLTSWMDMMIEFPAFQSKHAKLAHFHFFQASFKRLNLSVNSLWDMLSFNKYFYSGEFVCHKAWYINP